MALAICVRMAFSGNSKPAIMIMVSRRARASRGVLAWIVVSEPSWPVFMACSMSSASAPRHSPMMIRSGRIRKALRTRSVAVMAPLPSMLAGRVSSRTTWSCCNCNSAASSMVTMRSVLGMKLDSVFKSVVLPEPVPPEMMMFSRALIAPFQEHDHLRREGLEVQQVFQLQRIGAETADRHAGPVQRQRRNDRVETRAVQHAGIDHRAGFVHAAAHAGNDAVDDLHQVVVVAEDDGGLLHLPAPLDVDVLRPVDEDVADRRVLQQHLQRSQAERLVEHFADELLALVAIQQRVFAVAEVLDDQADFAAQQSPSNSPTLRQIELVDQLAVDPLLELVEVGLFGIGGTQCRA